MKKFILVSAAGTSLVLGMATFANAEYWGGVRIRTPFFSGYFGSPAYAPYYWYGRTYYGYGYPYYFGHPWYLYYPYDYDYYYPRGAYYGPPITGNVILQSPPSYDSRKAFIEVTVPNADTRVWFDGVATQQGGTTRVYSTPPLQRGRAFHYRLRVSWDENGEDVSKEKLIAVRAGERTRVKFGDTAESEPIPPPADAQKAKRQTPG